MRVDQNTFRRPIIVSLAFAATATLTAASLAHAQNTVTQLSHGTASSQQDGAAVSGKRVVWVNATTPPGSTSSTFAVVLLDLASALPATTLTTAAGEQAFSPDIDGTNIVWTRVAAGVPGDIVLYDVTTSTATTIASSGVTVHFGQPAVRGRFVAFLRVGTQTRLEAYDLLLGVADTITDAAASPERPRVGDDYIVYEDHGGPHSAIKAYQISTQQTVAIASCTADYVQPDIDGNTVVYVQQNGGGNDQVFAYDLVTQQRTQLTTVSSTKVLPRISGSNVVWSDARSGNFDLFIYDLSARVERALVAGAGDQFLADIDGDRVVYSDNASGFEQIFLVTMSAATQTNLSASRLIVGTGQAVTFTAAVTTSSDHMPAAGTVAFSDGATPLGTATLDAHGRASLTQTFSSTGTHAINANYTPAAGYLKSSASLTLTVDGAPTLQVPVLSPVEATGAGGAAVDFTVTATDLVDGSDAVTCSPQSGSTFALGSTTVMCSATNGVGLTTTATFVVTVRDTTPPQIISIAATPNMLWPANHKMVPVTLTVVAHDLVDPSPTCSVLRVTSNEPVDADGDWAITPNSLSLTLRAARLGAGSGRIYAVTVACTDHSGNVATAMTTITVPHDLSR